MSVPRVTPLVRPAIETIMPYNMSRGAQIRQAGAQILQSAASSAPANPGPQQPQVQQQQQRQRPPSNSTEALTQALPPVPQQQPQQHAPYSQEERIAVSLQIHMFISDPVFGRMIPPAIAKECKFENLIDAATVDDKKLRLYLQVVKTVCAASPSVSATFWYNASAYALDAVEAASFYAWQHWGTTPLTDLKQLVFGEQETQLLLRRIMLENGDMMSVDARWALALKLVEAVQTSYRINKQRIAQGLAGVKPNAAIEQEFADLV